MDRVRHIIPLLALIQATSWDNSTYFTRMAAHECACPQVCNIPLTTHDSNGVRLISFTAHHRNPDIPSIRRKLPQNAPERIQSLFQLHISYASWNTEHLKTHSLDFSQARYFRYIQQYLLVNLPRSSSLRFSYRGATVIGTCTPPRMQRAYF